jgi:hypothetical protein
MYSRGGASLAPAYSVRITFGFPARHLSLVTILFPLDSPSESLYKEH